MKIISTQFFVLICLLFSSAACLKVNVNLPPEKPDASDFKPQNSPVPPVLIEPLKSEPIAPLADDWRISLSSHGGYAGGGAGNFIVESGGKLFYQKPRQSGVLPAACETVLSAEETAKLKVFADDWRVPEEIGRNALKIAGNDAFGFKVEISSKSGTHELEYYENTEGLLPIADREFVKAVFALRNRACAASDEK